MTSNILVPIYVLEILERFASYEKRLLQKEILYHLEKDYNISVSLKTLGIYIKELRQCGYIEGKRGIYKVNRLTDNELSLLINGVLFAQLMPSKDAKALIEKLRSFSYISMKNVSRNICYIENLTRTDNTKLYEVLDTINRAIEDNKQIELTNCAYDTKGEIYEKSKSVVSPYYIVPDKSHIYLICYAGRNEDVENRRIDRISDVKILEESRVDIISLPKYKQGFDLSKYMKEHIYMFSGDASRVTLRIDKNNVGDFIDWFGKNYYILNEDENKVTISVNVVENAVYYWALQYGSYVEVIKPEKLRNRIIEGLKEILRNYEL